VRHALPEFGGHDGDLQGGVFEESAQFLADKQASLWPFLPEETPAVYEALNERFGKR